MAQRSNFLPPCWAKNGLNFCSSASKKHNLWVTPVLQKKGFSFSWTIIKGILPSFLEMNSNVYNMRSSFQTGPGWNRPQTSPSRSDQFRVTRNLSWRREGSLLSSASWKKLKTLSRLFHSSAPCMPMRTEPICHDPLSRFRPIFPLIFPSPVKTLQSHLFWRRANWKPHTVWKCGQRCGRNSDTTGALNSLLFPKRWSTLKKLNASR